MIEAGLLTDEASWRGALWDLRLPRDIPGWHPAVVLEVGASDARIGIEGIEEDADGHWIPASDVQWARPLDRETRTLGPRAQVAGDLVRVGDVVLVRAMMDGADFNRWSLRQVPEVQGGFMAMDVNTGRVLAMQGGFSYESSVFNRATQAQRQPGVVLQALRLCRGAGQQLYPLRPSSWTSRSASTRPRGCGNRRTRRGAITGRRRCGRESSSRAT